MALPSIGDASALPTALALIPSMPRPVLKRLVERMIDRIVVIDGDSDGDEDNAEDAFGFSPRALASWRTRAGRVA